MSRVFVSMLLLASSLFGGEYSKDDRATIVDYLSASRAALSASLESVSQGQSEFQAPNSWNMLQVLEHLMLAEDYLRGFWVKAVENTAPIPDSEKLPDPADQDRAIRKGLLDRTQKATAPKEMTPEGRFRNRDEAFLEFSKRREKTVEMVRAVKKDLRRIKMETPMGTMDAHQWLIMMGAHTERHMEQIAAIMRQDGYPKQ